MRFALLGDHPDGLDLVRALAATGRHELAVYSGPSAGRADLSRAGLEPRSVGDLEEVLADPDIDAVIVAGNLSVRRGQLLRALQSECHVLCVHPADGTPDTAYEAGLIQADTGRALIPLLPMALHPGVAALRAAAQASGPVRLIEMEIWSEEEVLLEADPANHKPGLPGWDVLRAIGGEIGEVFLQSTRTETAPGEPLLVTGRFVNGCLLHAIYLPRQAEPTLRFSVVTATGRTSLDFTEGWPGKAQLSLTDESGERRTQTWDPLPPWDAVLERLEQAVLASRVQKPEPGQPPATCLTQTPPLLGWQDALRGLELDDAARRSLERGRASTLDLQEATEEASFKGTMTLVGCSLIWLALVALILSVWIPWLAWGIVPVFGFFLILQGLRWVLPGGTPDRPTTDARANPTRRTPAKTGDVPPGAFKETR